MTTGGFEFDRATAVAPDGSAEIFDGWDIGGNANGGYLLALAATGLGAIADRPHPVTIDAHFLSPGTPGAVQVRGEVVKAGRRFSTVSGSLARGGKTLLQVVATFGDLSDGADHPVTHMNGAPPQLEPIATSPKRNANGPVPVGLMERLDVRLDPASIGFATGSKGDHAVMEGWFAFADDRPVDPLALLLAADALPPAVFNIDIPPGWVPTVSLSVHLRAIPAPGPIRCRFTTRFLHGGMFEEDGELWDEAGTLVAQSRQLALVPRT